MLTDTEGHSAAQSRPLTHLAYLAACGPRLDAAPARLLPWVQVRQRARGVPSRFLVQCGQVVELSANDGQWFKVQTNGGYVWAESRSLRLCSGDGRCICELPTSVSSAGLTTTPLEPAC